LLTESEVSRSWSKLFKNEGVTPETLDRAEKLVEELRPRAVPQPRPPRLAEKKTARPDWLLPDERFFWTGRGPQLDQVGRLAVDLDAEGDAVEEDILLVLFF